MKKLIYILAAILLGISSCKKEDESMVLSATILDDCSGKPLANFHMEAYVFYTCVKIGKPCSDIYFFDTDANGSFSLHIEKKGSAELRAYNGTSILKGIPLPNDGKEELHLGTFVARPTTSFVYRIKVNNPYNVGDTLYANLRSTFTLSHIVIPAPLQDTLFSIKTFTGLNTYPISDFIPIKIGYGVAHDNPNILTNWYIEEEYTINSKICNTKNNDTITIVVN